MWHLRVVHALFSTSRTEIFTSRINFSHTIAKKIFFRFKENVTFSTLRDDLPIRHRVKFCNFESLYLMNGELGFLKFADVVYYTNKSLPCKFQKILKKTLNRTNSLNITEKFFARKFPVLQK